MKRFALLILIFSFLFNVGIAEEDIATEEIPAGIEEVEEQEENADIDDLPSTDSENTEFFYF